MNAIAQPAARRFIRIWLIIETVLGVPAIPLGAFMALMSVMLFDAPGSERYPPVILLFVSIVTFPLLCIGGISSAWVALGRQRDRAALWLSLLPVVPLVTGILAIVWLEVANNGSFVP